MTTFVLVPGAWMGAWVWEPVTRGLRERGHDVHPVTLPGLEDPNADITDIGICTHVEAVLSIVRAHDVRNVVVVGHSTSGVVAGAAVDRAEQAYAVYIEAFLPHDGKSVLDAFGEPLRSIELRMIDDNHGRWPAPGATVLAEGQDLYPEQAERLAKRLIDHPGRPLTEPIFLRRPLQDRQATYVICRMDHFDDRLADDVESMRAASSWTFRVLDTGLWPMVSAPDELVTLLDRIAAEACSPGRAR